MTEPFIVDAHVHTGYPNIFFCPEVGARELLRRMDQFAIRCSINLGSMRNLLGADIGEMRKARREFQESEGRLYYCGFYDPAAPGTTWRYWLGGRLGRLQRYQDPPLVQQGFRGGPALRAGVGFARTTTCRRPMPGRLLQPRASPVHAGQVRSFVASTRPCASCWPSGGRGDGPRGNRLARKYERVHGSAATSTVTGTSRTWKRKGWPGPQLGLPWITTAPPDPVYLADIGRR
jgi:hypothetical protein